MLRCALHDRDKPETAPLRLADLKKSVFHSEKIYPHRTSRPAGIFYYSTESQPLAEFP
jgi:hypothetical protein